MFNGPGKPSKNRSMGREQSSFRSCLFRVWWCSFPCSHISRAHPIGSSSMTFSLCSVQLFRYEDGALSPILMLIRNSSQKAFIGGWLGEWFSIFFSRQNVSFAQCRLRSYLVGGVASSCTMILCGQLLVLWFLLGCPKVAQWDLAPAVVHSAKNIALSFCHRLVKQQFLLEALL